MDDREARRADPDDAPLITIGMPVYDGQAYLEEAIDSLLTQSESRFELLIADDHSTDDSLEIAEGFARKDPRVTVIPRATNLGMTANFEDLRVRATGTYFMWAAQDDRWDHDFLAEGVKLLEATPGAVGFIPGIELTDGSGTILTVVRPPKDLANRNPAQRARAVAKGGYHGIYALFRRERLPADLHLPDIAGTDCAFMFALLLEAPLMTSDRVLSFRRVLGYELVPGTRRRLVNAKSLGASGHLYSRRPSAMARFMLHATRRAQLTPPSKAALAIHVLVRWWALRWRWLFLSDSDHRIREALSDRRYLAAAGVFACEAVLSPRSAVRTVRSVRGDGD